MYIFFDISLYVFWLFFLSFFVTKGVVFVVNNVGEITTKYSSVFWLCSLSLFIHFSRKNLHMNVNVQTVCFLFVAFSSICLHKS